MSTRPEVFDVAAYLRSLSRFGMKPGLERIRAILARLGSPQESFRSVHVGGTNGKGSMAAYMASVLRSAGYRVGLYTSPHLIRYNERIRVDGAAIDDAALSDAFSEVARAVEEVRAELGSDPTEFEVGTAAAFLHFAREGVDVAVVEVGLGGRLDSTNVVHSDVVLLGPTSLDHTAVLGPDLGSIAREKAGIFRAGVPVVSAAQPEEAAAVIASEAKRLGAPLTWVLAAGDAPGGALPAPYTHGSLAAYTPGEWGRGGGRFDVWTPFRKYTDLRIGLVGHHQFENASVAVTACDLLREVGYHVREEHVRDGLARAKWPGRMQLVAGSPPILLDGVHNPGGAEALAYSLRHLFPGERFVFVVALMGEKDVAGTLDPLLPFASHIVFTQPASSRTAPADPHDLCEYARARGVSAGVACPAARALEEACDRAASGGKVCVCGSLYLVGEILELLAQAADVLDKERGDGLA